MSKKKNCGEENVCALFVLLERLERNGYFAALDEKDYEKAIENMIRYFSQFKDNSDKYDEFIESRPHGNFVKMIAKHQLHSVDFEEKIGTREVISDDFSNVYSFTEHDVNFKGDTEAIPHEKKDGVIIPYTLDTLNVKLDYEDSKIMTLSESIRGYLFSDYISDVFEGVHYVSIEDKENYFYPEIKVMIQGHLDNLMEIIKSSSALSNTFPLEPKEKAERFEMLVSKRVGIIFENILSNPKDSLFEEVNSNLEEGDSPIYINDISLKAKFIEIDMAQELIEKNIRESVKKDFMSIFSFGANSMDDSEKEAIEKISEEVFESVSEKWSGAIIQDALALLKSSEDNQIVEAVNQWQNGTAYNVTQSLIGNNLMDSSVDVIDQYASTSNKEGVKISFDAVFKGENGGKINLLPIVEKGLVRVNTIEPYIREVDSNDPTKVNNRNVTPNKLTFNVHFKRKVSYVEIKDFKEPEVKDAYYNSESMKYFMVDKSYVNAGNHDIFAIDEADAKADGVLAMVARNIADKADFTTISTGTAINGFPSSVVSLLAYNGKMDRKSVEQNKSEFTKQCGVYEVNSFLIGKVIFGLSNQTFRSEFNDYYQNYLAAIEKKENSGSNILGMMNDVILKQLMPLMLELDIAEREQLEVVEVEKEAYSLKALFDSMHALSKKANLSFDVLVKRGMENTLSLLKLVPAISSPLTYVQMIASTASDANFFINTREGVTGNKETITIEDHQTYMRNFEKDQAEYTKEEFIKNNRVGARVAQALVNEYSKVNFLDSTFIYLADNFKMMAENFTKKSKSGKALRETLCEHANKSGLFSEEMTEPKIYTLFHKKSTSSQDNIEQIYRTYLENNGNMSYMEEANIMPDKIALMKVLLSVYDDFIKEVVPRMDSLKEGGDDSLGVIQVDKYVYDLSGSNYYHTSAFKSLDDELPVSDLLKTVENGYPEGVVFSTQVDLCPDDFKPFFQAREEDGMYMPYKIILKRREENQVFDAVGSLGYIHKAARLIGKDKSFATSSSRTIGTIINLLSMIRATAMAQEERSAKKHVAIVLNMPAASTGDSFDLQDILKRVDESQLTKYNIAIHKVPRPLLDGTVKKLRASNTQVIVVSNYESAARGLDLSSLHHILSTSGMAKGRQSIQFSARLFSPKNQNATLDFFNGGTDGRFVVAKADVKKDFVGYFLGESESSSMLGEDLTSLVAIPVEGNASEMRIAELMGDMENATKNEIASILTKTENNVIAKRSIDTLNVYKGFMSGDSTSIESATGKKEKHSSPYSRSNSAPSRKARMASPEKDNSNSPALKNL